MNKHQLVWTGVLLFNVTVWAGAFLGAIQLAKLFG